MVWFSISLNHCSRDAGTVLIVPRGTQGRSFEHDGVAGVVREMTDKGTADKGTVFAFLLPQTASHLRKADHVPVVPGGHKIGFFVM